MNDVNDDEEAKELARLDYLDALGINSIDSNRFGRERGLNPTPTSSQLKDITKLASKLIFKSLDPKHFQDDEETVNAFDILSQPRSMRHDDTYSTVSCH